MSRPRFFAPEARAGLATVPLPPEEAHHLIHVLRLRAGADIAVFDGAGHEWAARVVTAGKRAATVELGESIAPTAEPPVYVTLAIGVLKGDQMDSVVRDATMLGVGTIAPFVSSHVSVASSVLKGHAGPRRWERVAVASAKQCGRAVVPSIAPIEPFDALLEHVTVDVRLMCVEPSVRGRTSSTLSAIARPASALVLIGPEGGWAEKEVELARRRGAHLVHLGPRTIRAETAPTVLLSALWAIWGW